MIKLLSVADIVTLMNAVMGFLALLMVFSNQIQLAASLILLALIMDGLDGIVARRMGNGQIGEHLEAIADMISLSVAPLALFYITYYDAVVLQPFTHLLLGVIVVFSLICSVIRLSSFSLLKQNHVFLGLPTSVSALFLVLNSFLNLDLWVVLPVVLLLSLAMISSIRFPKPGLKIDLITALFIIATILLHSRYYNIAPLLLLAALTCYVILGPILLRFKKKNPVTGTGDTHS
jgi:archaetidylserine synthase